MELPINAIPQTG